MLNKTIDFSLKNRLFILLMAFILMASGLYVATNMEVDVFPDLTAPTVVVMTDAHGMAAEEVEKLVTFPIETDVNGATDVRRVRSVSFNGFSFVWVEFDWGTKVLNARQIVSEKLSGVLAQMPDGVGIPALAPQSSVMGEVLFIGMQADSTSMADLRLLAGRVIEPLLLSTTGVSQVTIIGGDYRQTHVVIHPELLRLHGVSLDEVAATCQSFSHNSAGGVIREFGNEFVLRGLARTNQPDELALSVIKTVNKRVVTLGDVATVTNGFAIKMGVASQNGSPAVIISVSKQPGANTLALTQSIEERLNQLKATLPPDVKLDTSVFRQADFIETSVSNIQRALLEGGLFVIIILFVFLGSFRTTLISLLAIPLSLLGAILTMKWMGLTLNTMSLGGMAIAIGSLVDDAIIDVENVYKRLRQNHQLPKINQLPTIKVVYDASVEIRSSILNATLIIMVAFVPLFFLSGMEGRLLQPLGIAYLVSLFVSLIVAMTLTPLLCYLLLSDDKYLQKHQKEGFVNRWIARWYEKALLKIFNKKAWVIGLSTVFILISIGLLSLMGRSFLPEFNEGALTISAITKAGISLDESNRLGNIMEHELLEISEVESTARRTGRGELDEHSQTTNGAEIDVNFTLKDRNRQEFLAEVRQRLASIPGIATTVGQPLGHRIDHMLSGTRANIAIKLFGNEMPKLVELGNKVKNATNNIEGLVDVAVEQLTGVPQIQIRANRAMLAVHGISIETFNRFVDLILGGEKVGDLFDGAYRTDVVLKYDGDSQRTIESLKSMLLDTGEGNHVPLGDVADIISTTGPGSISRENVQRKLVVSANVSERDLRSVIADVKSAINQKVQLPAGYRIEYGGQFESEASASRTLMFTSLGALFIIFLLLYQEFKDWCPALIILINLPLALIGGVFTLLFTGGVVSIPAIIGFITLFGIAIRNGILLVSHYRQLEALNGYHPNQIIQGSVSRLNPILMTALTAALALIPLVMNGEAPGNEIQSPMAKVILGGLLTSTVLNLFVIPVVYSMFKKATETIN